MGKFLSVYYCFIFYAVQYICPTLVKQKDIHLQKSHKSQDKHTEVA